MVNRKKFLQSKDKTTLKITVIKQQKTIHKQTHKKYDNLTTLSQ